MSFLLDPPLLFAAGVGIGALAPDDTSATVAEAGTIGLFWSVSLSLWQDRGWVAWAPPLLGAESGRAFMLNSGDLNLGVPLAFDPAKRSSRRDAAAACIFATYPLWLHLGRRAGRRIRSVVESRRGVGAVAAPAGLGEGEPQRQESLP